MLLAQLHSNHTKTPSTRWARGKRCMGIQFNSRSSFHSPAREKTFHYKQVIAACDLHAFLSVQQKLRSPYCVQESDVFHYATQATTYASLKNSSIFEQDTSLNRPKLTCIAIFLFIHFNNFVNIFTPTWPSMI